MEEQKMNQQQTIDNILETTKTIAVVGLSTKKERAGFYVPEYLQAQGYRIIPVNPNMENALGEPAYPNLKSIPEPVDLVLIFQRSEKVTPFVEQAIEIGATAVWMQLGITNEKAAATARAAGLAVVMDACMLVEHRRRKNTKLSSASSV
jgi:predicted CoA-binding protein